MEKVYVFGHKSPDTDSVTSAIALAYLKRQLGMDAEARVIGNINDETKFVLDYFNVPAPRYLNDVRLQIKDIFYHKNFFVDEKDSIEDTYSFMINNNITGVPIVDNNKKFIGIITAKTILKNIFNIDNNLLYTSYENILKSLEGVPILRFEEELVGQVQAASYKSTTFIENIKLTSQDILIVGDRHSIIQKAIESNVKLIIITGNGNVNPEHIELAKNNKVNIIKTNYNTFKTVKKILLSNYIKTLIIDSRPHTVQENEYYEDFMESTKKLGFNNYPVVDKNNVCKGLIRLTEINKKNRKKIILVDHNGHEQSVIGIEEAEILEIIDHHNISNISTNKPISFRNMTVGSTNTIIYYLYEENRIKIPKQIAGLMFSGIISDTLNLTSPTTTTKDKEVIKQLEKILLINHNVFSKKMFEASLNLENKTCSELINVDIKDFNMNGEMFKVSQITTMYADEVLKNKDEFIQELEKLNCKFAILMITDISKNGAYILYSKTAQKVLERAFSIDIHQGMFLSGMLSRKKQMIPCIMDF